MTNTAIQNSYHRLISHLLIRRLIVLLALYKYLNRLVKVLKQEEDEVEAQGCETYEGCLKGKHLTPEAYALLKYNVLYLIERL